MFLTDISIKRPVFATVISLLLVTFGIISYTRLPLREYPNIDSPIITISTTYPGASASVVETKITQIIEGSVSGIEGLKTIESSSQDGQSMVSVEFQVNHDLDEATNDIRDKLSQVTNRLPDEASSPQIYKRSSNNMPDLMLGLVHPTMSQMELTDYADRYLIDKLSVVDGVAQAIIFGQKRYSMRIWLDRQALAARNLSVEDIETALARENVEIPAGRLESQDREFSLRMKRGYQTPDDFRNLVIKRGDNGYLITMGDVAKVEIAPATLRDSFKADGKNMVGMGVMRQSTANLLAMIEGVKAAIAELQLNLPEGMELMILRDSSVFINAAVEEVLFSLILAVALVLFIIFIFLGSVRAALVPAVAVPLSLIATFIVLYVMGFSVNLLTLLALVLAIGMVVDDAIIVIENIHRRMEEGEPALLAAYRGAREVGFVVIVTTIVSIAVFMPLSLMSGDIGKLFTEFAYAIAGALAFSGVIALTLSPMMCSKILKPQTEEGALVKLVDTAFTKIVDLYERALRRTARHPYLGLFVLILICGSVWILIGRLQSELEPQEDRSVLMLSMAAPEGSGFNATTGYMEQISALLQPIIDQGEAKHILTMVPGGRNSLGAVNSGIGIIELKPWGERERNATQIARELYGKLSSLIGIRAFVIQPPGLSSFFGQPIQFVIGGPTYEQLVVWRDILLDKAKKFPGLIGVDADYKETTPQYRIAVSYDRAAELGVSTQTIGRTLETMLGSRQVTTYVDNGEEYDVILQGAEEERRTQADLNSIYVRSSGSGQLIPLSNLVTIKEQAGASTLQRYNRIRAITISGSIAEGYTMSDCLSFLERTVREELPATAMVNYKGNSLKFKETRTSVIFVFILAVIIAYLVLAAQFESFVSPLVIMLTIPMGLFGATLGMHLLGVTLNIYSEIGLVMLIGLAAKNGILIVEFANQLRDQGVPFDDAVFKAARLRLRPIAMTGLSTAIGALPLIFASGAGAMSRIALGSVIFFGATSAFMLTLFVVPIGYFYFARSQASPKALERKLSALEQAPGAALHDSEPATMHVG